MGLLHFAAVVTKGPKPEVVSDALSPTVTDAENYMWSEASYCRARKASSAAEVSEAIGLLLYR